MDVSCFRTSQVGHIPLLGFFPVASIEGLFKGFSRLPI